ncbi:hypothetical protein [Paenibacillus glufosinatiresistens]|uniref:hypothetical protein n=1 Tax=Paenibacillus glufosinatiresistens TaxID=3070657 RepID=UPI00286E72D4|nr:hypothetical protein [Paenibacillus sp. YX.27]
MGVLFFLIWLVFIVIGLYLLVLLIKLMKRAIEALDLYNYSKNQEIRHSQNASYLRPYVNDPPSTPPSDSPNPGRGGPSSS